MEAVVPQASAQVAANGAEALRPPSTADRILGAIRQRIEIPHNSVPVLRKAIENRIAEREPVEIDILYHPPADHSLMLSDIAQFAGMMEDVSREYQPPAHGPGAMAYRRVRNPVYPSSRETEVLYIGGSHPNFARVIVVDSTFNEEHANAKRRPSAKTVARAAGKLHRDAIIVESLRDYYKYWAESSRPAIGFAGFEAAVLKAERMRSEHPNEFASLARDVRPGSGQAAAERSTLRHAAFVEWAQANLSRNDRIVLSKRGDSFELILLDPLMLSGAELAPAAGSALARAEEHARSIADTARAALARVKLTYRSPFLEELSHSVTPLPWSNAWKQARLQSAALREGFDAVSSALYPHLAESRRMLREEINADVLEDITGFYGFPFHTHFKIPTEKQLLRVARTAAFLCIFGDAPAAAESWKQLPAAAALREAFERDKFPTEVLAIGPLAPIVRELALRIQSA